MKPYLICTLPWNEMSAGITVLWKLSQALYERFPGNVFVVDKYQGPHSIPTVDQCKTSRQDCIAIYPEVVTGNPLNAGSVVRYLLNLPGVIAGPLFFPESEQLFIFSNFFNQKMNYHQDRVLTVPYLPYKRFKDLHQERGGKLYFIGKGIVSQSLDAKNLGNGIDFNGIDGQDFLINKLNHCEVLYSYDSVTAMTAIARLCGCPVVIIPNPQYTREECQVEDTWGLGGIGYGLEEEEYAKETIDSEKLVEYYEKELSNFDSHLDRFIEITQSNLPMKATESIKDGPIKVSICCATYNQVNILSSAIESFLMQRTTFPFEILIHDDASTDGTQELIKSYISKYPNLIRGIFQKENQFSKSGAYPYGEFLYPAAKGKYIAECDGDDYWTDPLKIQKQYDFMEVHPECSLCYHDYLIRSGNKYSSGRVPPLKYTRLEFINYPSHPYDIQTSTKFWRNIFTELRRQDFIDFTADIPTNVLLGMHGEAALVPEIKPSIFWYRSPSSSWCSLSKEETHRQTMKLWQDIYEKVERKGNPQWTALRKYFLSPNYGLNPINNIKKLSWREKLNN
jgi:glycosyltransferase involved in cell wall biosynthesis